MRAGISVGTKDYKVGGVRGLKGGTVSEETENTTERVSTGGKGEENPGGEGLPTITPGFFQKQFRRGGPKP